MEEIRWYWIVTREEVRNYIIESMSDVFSRGKVDYVKWDMNRNLSDYYSQGLAPRNQGEFAHRYILGLYQVIQTLTDRFPHILFEACASGGNRFDRECCVLCHRSGQVIIQMPSAEPEYRTVTVMVIRSL